MSIDLEALFRAIVPMVGRSEARDDDTGTMFRQLMASLVRFDFVVVFAYQGSETPIDLYSTFDAEEKVIYVTMYQAGPFLLDPFYHTARAGRFGLFRMRELAPDRFFSSEYYRSYYMQTRLAEEVGYFIDAGDGVTVVLSLMRKEKTGPFPAAEFALLKKAEPLVAALVRENWKDLSRRFEASRRNGRKAGQGKPSGRQPENRAEAVWRDLKLTSRETAIIDLVLQGHSSESIGLKLNISTGTVKVHRRNVYRKLGISSQTQLLSLYLKTFE
ncbi:helix-turn-helix domain-containing protein [Gellertiella hungarica]|uniref:DNA-binding CsgD family transcriptional regulator n=1 Tax=Gellertiella hungarica TaxID=1572859 RepID=A0A7W6J7M0_9HYPH|nr:helix-turn-helix transcriptional regulator [Gellertiella hungarica]MBB4066222.1 DNA-binding CsgD family transcriptional regulator [Gellertiella hungarica]